MITYSGVLIGDFLFYSLGRKYGRAIVTYGGFGKILSPQRLELLENKFNKWGILFIFIGGRLIGEIFLVAGILKMPRFKFLMLDALSSLFTVVKGARCRTCCTEATILPVIVIFKYSI